MEHTLTFLFCEGDHDAPFIRKILREDAWCNRTDQAMQNYPIPLRAFLKTEIQKAAKITETIEWKIRRDVDLPWFVLQKPKKNPIHTLVIWKTEGDSNYLLIHRILNAFRDYVDFNDAPLPKMNVALFYDADESIQQRTKIIKTKLTEVLPSFCESLNIDNPVLNNIDGFNNVGVFIFANEAEEGTLEDYIVPLMKKDNEEIFDKAEAFLRLSEETRRDKKWSAKKALIGITGQLQKSGKSNTVIITDTDYINKGKIQNDENAQKLIQFIQKIIG